MKYALEAQWNWKSSSFIELPKHISDIKVEWDTDNQISQLRQAKFIEEVSGAVEGKTISEAEESWVIGGSSLTTGAFHDALKSL